MAMSIPKFKKYLIIIRKVLLSWLRSWTYCMVLGQKTYFIVLAVVQCDKNCVYVTIEDEYIKPLPCCKKVLGKLCFISFGNDEMVDINMLTYLLN